MTRFYANIQGGRGEATRQGGAKSGIRGHIRGWDLGVRVSGGVDSETGKDVFYIYVTGGSNGHHSDRFLARITPDSVNVDARFRGDG